MTQPLALVGNPPRYLMQGLHRIEDFPEPPAVARIQIGMDGVDELFSLVPGTFTVITGYAGQGKSSWLMAAIGKLLMAGIPLTLASFETQPKPVLLRRLRATMLNVPEFDRQALHVGPADEAISANLSLIAQIGTDDATEMDISYLLGLAMIAVREDGSKLLIIDPWNEIEHKRASDESETDYTGRAIRAIKRFCRRLDCAVWLVAHPRKPQMDGRLKKPSLYDLAGSANFANKADYGIIIHREDLTSTLMDFKVCKVRMGLPGRMGEVTLNFDHRTSNYAPWKAQPGGQR